MLQKARVSGVSTVDLWSLIYAGTQRDSTTDSTIISAIDINSHLGRGGVLLSAAAGGSACLKLMAWPYSRGVSGVEALTRSNCAFALLRHPTRGTGRKNSWSSQNAKNCFFVFSLCLCKFVQVQKTRIVSLRTSRGVQKGKSYSLICLNDAWTKQPKICEQ